MDAIQPAQIEKAWFTVLAPKRLGSSASPSTTASWTQWQSRIRTPFQAWAKESMHLGMRRYFRVLDASSKYCQVEISEEDRDKTALLSIMVFSNLLACDFGWNMCQRCFNEQWMSYWRKYSGNLPSPIYKNRHSFSYDRRVQRTRSTSIEDIIRC